MTNKSIDVLLKKAFLELRQINIPTAQLDAEILMAYTLGCNRPWIHAHGEKELDSTKIKKFEDLVKRRAMREPLAYILGKKEFYGRDFIVSPDVLIPRPETEDLVELVLEIGTKSEKGKVLDVGCGSGAIGITLKLEQPEWNVTLSDISEPALKIARKNAQILKSDVSFIKSDLLSYFHTLEHSHFDLVVANLPYVDHSWQRSPETDFEPPKALFADNDGTDLIQKLIEQSPSVLTDNGYILLEADPEQHESIIASAQKQHLELVNINGYAICLQKTI